MSDEISVSVVIPTWNAAKFVEQVLHCLRLQEGVSFEVLVVDNGVVNDETEKVVESFKKNSQAGDQKGSAAWKDLRYLRFEKQLGYAGAVNAGTKEAKYPLVASINNDNLPEPSWLKELLAEYLRQKQKGSEAIVTSLVKREGFDDVLESKINIFGRIVRPANGSTKKSTNESVEKFSNDSQQGNKEHSVFHPDGSAFLFNKEVFGLPYDEDYFIYHEDVYLGWRERLEGRQVFMAIKSKAKTFDGGSTRRIAYKTAFFTERNRWLNYFLFLSRSNLLRLLPALFFDLLLKLVFGSNRKAKFDAWVWLFTHPEVIAEKRKAIQSQRKVEDEKILSEISSTYQTGNAFLNRIFSSVLRICGVRLGL